MQQHFPRVFISPTYELAKDFARTTKITASIAEYGENVIDGSLYTLANHTKMYLRRPSACLFSNLSNPISGTILISHIDANTVGGVLALMGIKPECDNFWYAVSMAAENVPNYIYKIDLESRLMLNAFWAWREKQQFVKYTAVTDVTDVIFSHKKILESIIDLDDNLIEEGRAWVTRVFDKTELCLVSQTKYIKAYKSPGIYCSDNFTTDFGTTALVTITQNTKSHSITIALSDDDILSAIEIAQRLWGLNSNGNTAIAWSPSDMHFNDAELEDEFLRTISFIKNILSAKGIC